MRGNPVNNSNKDAYLKAAIESHQKGNLQVAKDIYRAILSQDPKNSESIFRLGTMALQLNQYEKAAEYIGKAIKIGPPRISMYINQGAALKHLDQHDGAIKAYNKALKIDKHSVDALFNKGCVLQAQNKFDKAKDLYLKALSINSNNAEIWINLGAVEKELGDNKRAIYSFEKAGELNPKLGAVYSNIGAILFEEGLEKTGLKLVEKAIELEPKNSKYLYDMSTFWLARGDLERGWKDYEKRFLHSKISKGRRPPPPPPYWEGQDLTELKDKNILFWTEQGLGEELISSSIIPKLIKKGLKFSIECTSKLVPILSKTYPQINFYSWEEHEELIRNKKDEIDYQYPLLSVLKFFFKQHEQINYGRTLLKPDIKKTNILRKKYKELAQGRRIVGISWKSTSMTFGINKTIPLKEWDSIINRKDIFCVNLQYGECQKEINSFNNKFGSDIYFDNSIKPLEELETAFAQIAAMDLVISISNSNIHFAGSMGIPAFSIIPRSKGLIWYWFTKGTHSPWYPSVRLFRETSLPDTGTPWWPTVIDNVTKELSAWLKKPLDPRIES